jgi:hypothetical protein
MLDLVEQEPFQGIGESTLASSVLAEDRNTPVVLGEIQRQIEACPAEPAYMKLSKGNYLVDVPSRIE